MMRVSDLLASEVRRADGTVVGRVREVRIVQDGPIIGNVQAGFRVDALLVGNRSVGIRLGYHSGSVRGPWLLAVLFRGINNNASVVPMTDVATWDDEQRIVTLH